MQFITSEKRRATYFLLLALLAPSFATATTIISDPIGDAGLGPDIVSIAGGYDATNLYLSASFAPGTLNLSNLSLWFLLDTDTNTATGLSTGSAGEDYVVSYKSSFSWEGPTNIQGPTGTLFWAPFQTHLFPNKIVFTVPLSLLGNDDGVVNFGAVVVSTIWTGCADPFQTSGLCSSPIYQTSSDVATGHDAIVVGGPNLYYDAYTTLSGPTSPIPEPQSFALLAIGVMALMHGCRKRSKQRELLV